MGNYLVTGGAGFIGSHLVEALLKLGHRVRVIDDFDTGSRKNLDGMPGELEVIEGSIAHAEVVREAMRGIEVVYHEAARGSVPRSVENPAGTHLANATGTLHVLEQAHRAGVRRVICASSSSVYGETAILPKEESMIPEPISPYAMTKHMMEQYCSLFYRVYGLETVCLRYFNVFGPRQNPDLQYAAVIPIFIRSMLQQRPCTFYGDGEQTRDFTYIEDVVQANLIASTAPEAAGQIMNVAGGQPVSVRTLFDQIRSNCEYDLPPDFQPPRSGDIRHSYGSGEKAKVILQFQPKCPLAEGLKKTVQWHRQIRS